VFAQQGAERCCAAFAETGNEKVDFSHWKRNVFKGLRMMVAFHTHTIRRITILTFAEEQKVDFAERYPTSIPIKPRFRKDRNKNFHLRRKLLWTKNGISRK
ncbi:MAG: hypothetical protein LLF97_07330, partial [Planctomycetaceae bacterium]|nr:hypothetical protein [Planctomycetaceae bacterium]